MSQPIRWVSGQAAEPDLASGTLIHNPRLISTLLFLGLRWLLGPHADALIRSTFRLFAVLDRLPTPRVHRLFRRGMWAQMDSDPGACPSAGAGTSQRNPLTPKAYWGFSQPWTSV